MGDENLYLQVDKELKSGIKDDAIWAKARALSKGDDKESTHKYIELKVQHMKDTVRSQKNEELLSVAKKGGKAIGFVGIIFLSLFVLFFLVYVIPNLI